MINPLWLHQVKNFLVSQIEMALVCLGSSPWFCRFALGCSKENAERCSGFSRPTGAQELLRSPWKDQHGSIALGRNSWRAPLRELPCDVQDCFGRKSAWVNMRYWADSRTGIAKGEALGMDSELAEARRVLQEEKVRLSKWWTKQWENDNVEKCLDTSVRVK